MTSLNSLAQSIHATAREKGWWDEKQPFSDVVASIHAELSELLEAYLDGSVFNDITWTVTVTPGDKAWVEPGPFADEQFGADQPDTLSVVWVEGGETRREPLNFPESVPLLRQLGMEVKPEGIPIKLADIIIRTLDVCAALGIDIDEAVDFAMRYKESMPPRRRGKRDDDLSPKPGRPWPQPRVKGRAAGAAVCGRRTGT